MRADERHDVVGPIVCLHVNFRQVAVAIVLHQLLQFLDLAADHCPGFLLGLLPGIAALRLQSGIGLPAEIQGLEPIIVEQFLAI